MAKRHTKFETVQVEQPDTTNQPVEKVEQPGKSEKPEMTKSSMVREARAAGHETNDAIRQFVKDRFGVEVTNSCIWSALNSGGERKDRTKKGGLDPDDLIFLHKVAGRIGASELAQLAGLLERVSAAEVERYIGALHQIATNGTENK